MKSQETTTHLSLNETYGEDEITLVENEDEALAPPEEENSVTLKIRQTRRLSPEQVTRRLQGIEQQAKKDAAWKFRIMGILEICEQLIVWFDAWIRKKGASLVSVKGTKTVQQKRKVLIGPKKTTVAKKPKGLRRPSLLVGGAVFCLLLVVGLFSVFHQGEPEGKNITQALDAEGLRAIKLSPLVLIDLGKRIVDPNSVRAGRPFYAEFDVLDWNEQEGSALDLSVDVRVFSQKGKVELFRPDVIKYTQATDKQTDKVHMKLYFNFTKEAALGEYRLSFTVTEAATQRKAMMEKRITIKN